MHDKKATGPAGAGRAAGAAGSKNTRAVKTTGRPGPPAAPTAPGEPVPEFVQIRQDYCSGTLRISEICARYAITPLDLYQIVNAADWARNRDRSRTAGGHGLPVLLQMVEDISNEKALELAGQIAAGEAASTPVDHERAARALNALLKAAQVARELVREQANSQPQSAVADTGSAGAMRKTLAERIDELLKTNARRAPGGKAVRS